MSKIESMKNNNLKESPSTPGITRYLAFKDEMHRVLRAQSEPGVTSGWHHHGDYEVYGYVASGSARFESGPGGKESVSLETGDFFHVPPHTVHREINPSSKEKNEVILFLHGTGELVVNVERPKNA